MVRAHLDAALAGARAAFDLTAMSENGLRHDVVRYLPERAPDGTVRGVVVVISEMTERKRAESEHEDLLRREESTRLAAEAARRRTMFLAEASDLLSSSLDYEATLRSVARIAVPDVADWYAVDIVTGDGGIERLAVAHVDPAKESSRRS